MKSKITKKEYTTIQRKFMDDMNTIVVGLQELNGEYFPEGGSGILDSLIDEVDKITELLVEEVK